MKKRVLSVLLATSMVATMAAGASALTVSAEEKKTIKFFHRFPDEPYNSFIESKIAEYEEAHPDIDIVVESAQNNPYKEKLKVVVGGDDCPDIFFSWCGEFTERFIREDLILDLTPYLEADTEWKESLMESQMVNYTLDNGMVYGIPFRLDAKLFFYNIDQFEEAGVEVPTTWDELVEVCEKLQEAGFTPIAYGNQDLWPSAHYIGTLNQMLVSDEVRAVDYTPTTGAFTDPGYQTALEYYEKLIPYFNENSNGITADMARSNFCMGMGAMYYAEVIEIPYISDPTSGLNPDLNYGMFKFPEIEGPGNPNILTGVPEGFVVSSKTEYPDECVEFLKWFLGKEVGTEQAQTIGWFNASIGTTEGVTDQTLLDAYNVITSAEEMGPWFDNALYSTVCDEYLTAASDLTNGDVTPAEAMEKIQAKALEAQTLAAQTTEE
ncbi:MAG: extracellular solute-binding protein [Eubacteriales bacterium]|nr:extracellular solute-binding protein [Eubacteriales bacterium]